MIFKYKIHCITENIDCFWLLPSTDPAPTKCPNNSAHTVDPSSVVVLDKGTGAPMQVVTQYEMNDKDLKLARASCELSGSNHATMSVKIPGNFGSSDGRYVAGGYSITEDYNKDDFITIYVEDTERMIALAVAQAISPNVTTPLTDNQIQQMGVLPGIGLAFPNYPIVKSYTDDDMSPGNQGWYFWPMALGNNLEPVGECEVEPIGGYGFIPAGMYLNLIYNRPSGVTTGGCRVNLWWGKKE